MKTCLLIGFWGCALLSVGAVRAQAVDTPLSASVGTDRKWEGAIGLNTGWRPEYSGSRRQVLKLSPGFFLRYGRFTVTNSSGFVTRRADDVERGLGLDLTRSDRFRANLALRFDAGRSEDTSGALKGVGDIRPTVRVRAAATYRFDGPWRLGASWSVDAFGRGGGSFGDITGAWESRIAPTTVLTVGSSLAAAGDRYMQTYYGISPQQAARTRYAAYEPSAGLRDAALFTNVRHDIGNDWIVLGGVSLTRLLGPAADSPLTTRKTVYGLSAGLAWRF
ncbi:MAG: MipA/OmpV family protein [Rubrivivax sp.]